MYSKWLLKTPSPPVTAVRSTRIQGDQQVKIVASVESHSEVRMSTRCQPLHYVCRGSRILPREADDKTLKLVDSLM